MNQEDEKTRDVVNAETDRRGLKAYFAAHRFYPMNRSLSYWLDTTRVVRINLAFREVDIFTYDRPDSAFGSSIKAGGPFKGRGWRQRLANAAADAVVKARGE